MTDNELLSLFQSGNEEAICYPTDMKEEADEVIHEWMNSF